MDRKELETKFAAGAADVGEAAWQWAEIHTTAAASIVSFVLGYAVRWFFGG